MKNTALLTVILLCAAPCGGAAFAIIRSSSSSSSRLVTKSASLILHAAAAAADAKSAEIDRRGLFGQAATFAISTAAGTMSGPGAVFAAGAPPTKEEIQRIKTGYEGIVYLLNNFEQETTVCRENGGECKRDADAVRKYLGLRSTTDPLFQIEKVFNKVKYMDNIDPDKLDAFFEATEDWNSAMTMSNSMSFISQFGEYNPGGGKDEVLKYLNEAQKQVILAEKALKTILDCIDV